MFRGQDLREDHADADENLFCGWTPSVSSCDRIKGKEILTPWTASKAMRMLITCTEFERKYKMAGDSNEALREIGIGLNDMAEATAKQAEANLKTAETLANILQSQFVSMNQRLDILSAEMRGGFGDLKAGQAQRNVKFQEVDGSFNLVKSEISNIKEQQKKSWDILDALRADRNKLWAGILMFPVIVEIIVLAVEFSMKAH